MRNQRISVKDVIQEVSDGVLYESSADASFRGIWIRRLPLNGVVVEGVSEQVGGLSERRGGQEVCEEGQGNDCEEGLFASCAGEDGMGILSIEALFS